jgi:hypothetical protein
VGVCRDLRTEQRLSLKETGERATVYCRARETRGDLENIELNINGKMVLWSWKDEEDRLYSSRDMEDFAWRNFIEAHYIGKATLDLWRQRCPNL